MRQKLERKILAFALALIMAFTVIIPGNLPFGTMKTVKAATDINDLYGVSLGSSSFTYTGSPIEPTVNVYKNMLSTIGSDCYDVVYENNVNVGTATVTVTGKESKGYTGTITKTFEIKARSIKDATIAFSDSWLSRVHATYDGAYYLLPYAGCNGDASATNSKTKVEYKYMPEITVKINGTYLVENEDYSLKNNIPSGVLDVSTETDESFKLVYVDGIGNYTDDYGNFDSPLLWKICQTDISDESLIDISLTDSEAYTGSPITPEVTVTNNISTYELVCDKDYTVEYSNNTNVGTASVTITGIDGYTGTVTRTFEISETSVQKTDISGATVTLNDATYTGQAVRPDVTVKVGDTTLAAGTDYTITYSNNIEAAKSTDSSAPTVKITGKGSYTGSVSQKFTINPKDIGTTSVTAADSTYVSPTTGATTTFSVIDNDRNVTLKSGSGNDYTYSISDNKSVGQGTITITGCNNYTGTKTAAFTINPCDASKFPITVESPVEYTGTPLTPAVTIKNTSGTFTLDGSTDYDLTYENNDGESDYGTVVVTYKGNFTGTGSAQFEITDNSRTSITGATITLDQESYTYTGEQIKPVVTVTLENKELKQGTDYTVTYGENINYSTNGGTVEITGIGSYKGTISQTFAIDKLIITENETDDIKFVYDRNPAYQNGAAVKPEFKITYKGIELVEYSDNTHNYDYQLFGYYGDAATEGTGYGEGKIFITWGSNNSNFKILSADGSVTYFYLYYNVNIGVLDINDLTLEMTDSYEYTGSEIKPDIKLTSGSLTLQEGTDYTVTYSDNVNPGTATATITAKEGSENYTGTKTVEFTITKKDIKSLSPVIDSSDAQYTYTGESIIPKLTGFSGSVKVDDLTGFTVTANNGSDCIDAGTYKYTVSANDDNPYFTGSVSDEFTITKFVYDSVTIETGETGYTYTGSAIEPAVTVYYNEEAVPKDRYSVSYSNNISAGTARINVIFSGNYSGEFSKNFSIFTKNIGDSDITISDIESQKYTGEEIKPTVTVKYGETELVENKDYGIVYTNNKDISTSDTKAQVLIAGIGNYTGTVTKEFDIVSDVTNLSDGGSIEKIADMTYTGSEIKPSVIVTYGSETLKENTDYKVSYANNVNAGTATVTVTGAGNYAGSLTATFNILQADICDANVTLSQSAYTYSGSECKPSVTVKDKEGNIISSSNYTVEYRGNINAGDGSVVVITGTGNYTGAAEYGFTINKKDISGMTINGLEDKVYTGEAITMEFEVKDGDDVLSPETDYDVTYTDNTYIGTAKVTVTGKGNYTGTIEGTFEITARPLVNLNTAVISDIADEVYDGTEKRPVVSVTCNGAPLTENTDYTVSYSNNTDAGTATITITAVDGSDYSGSIEKTFTINPMSIEGAEVTLSDYDSTYDGSAKTPEVTSIKVGETVVIPYNADYFTIAYENNTDAGDATVKLTAKADTNYTGTATGTFAITALNITDNTDISISVKEAEYTGDNLTPAITVTYKNNPLNVGTDYVVTEGTYKDAGSYTVTVTGTGNFAGIAEGTFVVNKASLSKASYDEIATQVYTGSAVTPDVSLTYNGAKLEKGVDYTLSYDNNINVTTESSKASVIVTATSDSNFTGSLTIDFNIEKITVDLKNAVIADIPAVDYDGTEKRPTVSVTCNGVPLTEGTDYTVSYINNKDAGTATVTITAVTDGNYSGSNEKTFTINKLDISALMPDMDLTDKVYTGQEIKPELIDINGDAGFSVAALNGLGDFDVAYSDNINVGTASVVVSAKTDSKNYTGEITTGFVITAKSLDGAVITFTNGDKYTYTGAEIKPDAAVTLDGADLAAGKDYTIGYSGNTDVGTATFTISGTGNYTGTASKVFAIDAADIADSSVSSVNDESYTGAEIKPEPVVTYGNNPLVKDEDYTFSYASNVSVGNNTAVITITGKGNFTGTKEVRFSILQASIGDAVISGVPDTCEYTGMAVTFDDIAVTLDGKPLNADTDYEIIYADNLNAGNATVTITGKGNYTDSLYKTFEIKAKDISKCTFSSIDEQTYTGKAITPSVKVTDGDYVLGTDDYDISYTGNTDASSSAAAVIKGKGNYTGTYNVSFVIAPMDINDCNIADIEGQIWNNGEAVEPDVSITNPNNSVSLVKDADYTLTYSNNKNVTKGGEPASVTIEGKGNYNGTATKTFTISKEIVSIEGADARFTGEDNPVYDGSEKTPEIELTYNGEKLTENVDYTLSYIDNKNAGTASIVITGMEDYNGTKTVTFEIAKRDITGYTVNLGEFDRVYTGQAITPVITSVSNGDYTAILPDDSFETEIKNNTDAGTATITITGTDNYTGTATGSFDIEPADISKAVVTADSVTYTGSEVVPENVAVTIDGVAVLDSNYTLTYGSNIAAGSGSITVTGKNNYTGTATGSFDIVAKDISECDIPVLSSETYTGRAIKPAVSITDGDTVLFEGKDYEISYTGNINVTKADTYALVTIKGINNYAGQAEIRFAITSKDLSDADVSGISDSYCTGSEVTFDGITVRLDGTVLTLGVDYTVAYADNTEAGIAKALIIGTGNYSGSIEKSFTIRKYISDCDISDIPGQVFTGNAVQPEVTVKDGDKTLVKDVDYTVEYVDNINVTTEETYAKAVISGLGYYEGTAEISFSISREVTSIGEATVSEIPAYTYTGKYIIPEYTISYEGTELKEGVDYTAAISGNLNAGTAVITITGKGDYTGTKTAEFVIEEKSLTDSSVMVSDLVYTGEALTPDVEVLVSGVGLVQDKDYTIEYTDNIDAGTAHFTVTGKGNYKGVKEGTFEIAKREISDSDVSDIAGKEWTGSEIEPEITVTSLGRTLEAVTDYTVAYYNNTDETAESVYASAVITACGNYTGRVTKYFTITKGVQDITGAVIEGVHDFTYNGENCEPEITVTFDGNTLEKGVDYIVSYKNNKDAGKATVTVTGTGKYTGQVSDSYTINPRSIDNMEIVLGDFDATYSGSAIKPNVAALGDITDLTGFVVTYNNNVDAGTAKVMVAPEAENGNYTGTASKEFVISQKDITGAVVKASDSAYTGEAQTPDVAVILDGKTLGSGSDYSVSYSNNKNAGTAEVFVSGVGNYTGSASGSFEISAISMEDTVVTSPSDVVYSGSENKPAVTVSWNEKTLAEGSDYTVSYSDDTTNAGMVIITVTGKGNFYGNAETSFEINKLDISDAVIEGISDSSYTGQPVTFDGLTVTSKTGAVLDSIYYTVSYSNNTNIGTATVTVTGTGNYEGYVSATYQIGKVDISDAVVDGIVDKTYTGSELTQDDMTVTLSGTKLIVGEDYTVTYSGNTDAGDAEISIEGMGAYTGTINKTFTINPHDLSNDCSILPIEGQVYTGSAVTPDVTVVYLGNALKKDVDYTVSYADNVNENSDNSAIVTVTGKGNFTGTLSGGFSIQKDLITISGYTLNVDSGAVYTGSEIKAAFTISDKDGNYVNLIEGTDYTVGYANNVNVGTATITVAGCGIYTGTLTGEFEIAPYEISGANTEATLNRSSYSYDGTAKTPVPVSLKITNANNEDIVLTDMSGFDISYSGNTEKGTASLIITAKENTNYTGSVTADFVIEACDISGADIAAADCTYSGDALTTEVTVTVDGKTLAEGTDYEAVYSNNTNVGTATVTIKGIGNYTGEASKTFAIKAKSIADATVTAKDTVYTGSEVTTGVTVVADGKTLKEGVDYTLSYSNNTDVTTEENRAKVTAYGIGNYTGNVSAYFDINIQSIEDAEVSGIVDATFNRGAIVQSGMKLTLNGTVLTEGTDYTVSYADNVNVGTAKITITGKGIYTGTLTESFVISAWDVTDVAVIADIADQAYAGTDIEPSVKVTVNGRSLTADTDYTVTYSNNKDIGTAGINVTFIGNYTGSTETSFAIVQKDLADCTIEAMGTQIYTGNIIEPAVVVKNGDVILTKGVDYTASYDNNINVTTADNPATVTITGMGNYKGTNTATFTIVKEVVDISKTTVAPITGITYTGSAIEPELTITYNGYTLIAGQDYEASYKNNVNTGTATVTITGKESFKNSVETSFEIGQMDITGFEVTLDKASYEYTGAAIKPDVVSVKNTSDGYSVPLANVTVTYGSNTDVGTGTVTITAVSGGNYTGKVTAEFEITKASVEDAVITVADDGLVYTGEEQKPKVTVQLNGKTLDAGNYTITYDNNINASDNAKVTITGTGNYTGSAETEFTIAKKNLADCTVEDVASVEYDNTAKEPEVTVRNGNLVLNPDTDYTVTYTDNINVTDKAKITIQAKADSNYTGQTVKQFAITAISITDADVSGISDATYTGSAITFADIEVMTGGSSLVKDKDYTVTYADNTNAGQAKVTIDGKGNYTGQIEKTFNISEADLQTGVISGVPESVDYKGSAYTFDITVTLDGKTLKAGTDYKVTYESNTNIGTAKVTVTGIGNYKGSIEQTFEINAIDISTGKAEASNQVYTGKALTPSVKVTFDGNTLPDTDYTVEYSNNINVGTATFTVTGKGNCSGNVTGKFNILPKAPTNLKFDTADTSSVTVSWSKVTGATGYRIYRYNASTKSYTYVGTTTSLSYKVTGLSNATDYTIAVSAIGTAADKSTLEGAKATVKTNTAPNALTTLVCSAKTDSTVTLKWNQVSGCTGYRIFRYDSATKSYITLKTVVSTTTSYTDTGLKASTAYRYIVRPYINKNGKVLWGGVKAVNVGTRPTSVTGLRVTARGTNSIKLTWNRNTTASGYMVYRYNPGTKTWTRVKTIKGNTTTTFIGTGLSSGTSYIYRVYTYKAYSAGNVPGAGVSIKDTTVPAIPATVVKAGSGRATISWTASTGTVAYEVYMSTSYNGTYVRIGSTKSSVRTLTKTGLTKGRRYYFKVRAYRVLNGVKIYSGYSTIKSVVVK